MSDQKLSFKQMCAKFDVTPRTLRYYEYIELLQCSGRVRPQHSVLKPCDATSVLTLTSSLMQSDGHDLR
jgi:hypothetical protein